MRIFTKQFGGTAGGGRRAGDRSRFAGVTGDQIQNPFEFFQTSRQSCSFTSL